MSNLNTSWLINQLEKDIKAQLARIAELEEYIGRLESSINRSHHHMTANNKAVALNILRAYITEEKETGESDKADVAAEAATQAEECGITPMDLSGFDATLHGDSEARPDYGPAACGKSRLTEQLGFIWRESERPELVWAFTAEARGERYLKLIEQLGDDSTTFRAWWADIRR